MKLPARGITAAAGGEVVRREGEPSRRVQLTRASTIVLGTEREAVLKTIVEAANMSRQTGSRNLTLTEELERLEQSITLTLQEIDSNFSKAHRIVTTSILPIVEEYARHSSDVWDGSKVHNNDRFVRNISVS